jgi:hypothetical protein
MSKFDDISYETIIHDTKTGRLAPLAEIIARHSREQNISLEDADAYVKEMLEIPTSRFHIEDEHVDDEESDEDLARDIQRVQHAQVAAQTLLATTTLLTQAKEVGLDPDRIKQVLHGAFGALEVFYTHAAEVDPYDAHSHGHHHDHAHNHDHDHMNDDKE